MNDDNLIQDNSCKLFTTLLKMNSKANSSIRLSDISLLISKSTEVIDTKKSTINKKLKSNTSNSNEKRFSFLSANPSQKIIFQDINQLQTWQQSIQKDNSQEARKQQADTSFKVENLESSIPFHSGWIGYFSYPTPSTTSTNTLAEFHYYPWSICFDHSLQRFYMLGNPDSSAEAAYAWLLSEQLDQQSNKLAHKQHSPQLSTTPFLATPFIARWTKSDYQKAFTQIQNYLLAGDCYQVNLTHPFICSHYDGSTIDVLQPLFNALQPNFGCYFQGESCELVSMSPERFISINDSGKLEAKPIKGTIKRSDDAKLDKELITALSNSTKNKAENLMIVDLLRNDLSISATTGSVKVEKLFELETHPNVHHLVSTISAQLKPEISHAEAINRAFPGGSITGAPKKRAMEIIDELEAQPRSLYCGSFGYFSDTGHTDFNILIRSLEFRNKTITCWGGGGITVDSNCDEEYEESLTKIQRIMDVVESLS